MSNTELDHEVPWGGGTIGEALLEPTVIYVPIVMQLLEKVAVKVSSK